MEQVEARLRRQGAAELGPLQVLGPAPSPIPRLRGRFRDQLLLKGSLGPDAKRALVEQLETAAKAAPGVEFQVDVDPVHML
jgi:primosomal protein N' (replication factor Y)